MKKFANLTLGPNGTINHANRTLSVVGDWTNSGTYTTGGGNTTVAFAGTTQSLNGTTTFRKLIINASSTTVLNANVTVTSQLIVSGTLDPNETPTHTVSGSGKLTVNSGGKLLVKASTFGGNYALSGAPTLNAASTVDYAAATANQTINNSFVYATLRISGGLIKTPAGNLPALNSTTAQARSVVVAAGTPDLASFTAHPG